MSKRPWLGLFAVLAAILMNLLDSTIVNVAAPAIRAELGGSYTDLQWVVAGYTLALAVGLLTGGRLGDMFGRKRMIMIGITGFLAASIACALAPTMTVLVVARVLQGLIGALMIPQGFGLIRDLFPPQQMSKAFAALGPVIGLSTVAGPIAAGLLVDADLFGTGWRMIFLINVPLAGFALLAGRIALPAATMTEREDRPRRLDLTGMALAAVGMFLLVFPLVQGHELGWPTWTLLMLAAAVPVIGIFAAHQLRLRRSGRTPLVELSVFTRRSYTSGVAFVVVFFGAIVGLSLAVGLFLQLGLGYSPTRASLTMATWALGAFLGSGFSAGAMAKLGRRILHLGLSLMVVGGAALYVVLTQVGAAVGVWHLAAPLLVFGLGMGMIFVPLFDIIMGEIGDREVGSAAGLLESIQQAGGSLGVAVLGTVFFSVAGPTTAHGVLDPASSVDAAGVVTLLTVVLTAVSFGLGFLLPRRARGHATPQTPSADQAATAPAAPAAELALAAA
jgi:EmrB/QacA subfamily drug resistance transporter